MNQDKTNLQENWWLHLQGERVYYLQCGGTKLRFVIDEVDYLYDTGYRIINVFVPYHGHDPAVDGPPSYCGLAPIDYYNVDPAYGTNEEWAELIDKAHTKGMAVIMWINLGYTSPKSEYWVQAQLDKKNAVHSIYSDSFYWSETGEERLPEYFRWIFDEVSGYYYAAIWGKNPQFDWSKEPWPEEAKKVLRYWLDTGVDGFVVDAAGFYLNMTPVQEIEIVTGIPAEYGNKFLLPEGVEGGAPGYWIGLQGYTHVFDNDVTDWDDETAIAPAIRDNDPSYLEHHFQQVRDQAVELGGGAYTYNGARGALKGDQRQHVLQAAVHVGAGIHMQIDGLVTHNRLWRDTREGIDNVFNAANINPALAPGTRRQHIPTSNDTKYYAVLRTSMDGKQQILAVFNFQDSEQTITVDLSVTGITAQQIPVDLVNSMGAAKITSESYSILLPPYGFAFLPVDIGE
jgi:glycosidase